MRVSLRTALASLLFAGCAMHRSVGTASSPGETWTPPADVTASQISEPAKVVLPPNITPGMMISLPQIIDIALSNNTQTRIAWLNARAAEASLGSAQSAYLPEVDGTAQITRSRTASSTTQSTSTTYGPSLALNYLLFDFGGRAAEVEASRQALIAADYLHNQAIQDVILRVQQAYYGYLDSKALLTAQESTIKERETALDSADARHRAGVATIADVLQARTALSQARLTYDTVEGSLRTIEGLLSTTMGLPATTRFELGELPVEVPTTEISSVVDALISDAVSKRPDLAAQRAEAKGADARITQIRSSYRPAITATSSIGESFFGTHEHATPYSAGIALRWPLFTGFRNVFDVREAEFNAQAAHEVVRATEQQVMLQVWTSYYGLQTATRRLSTARDLLASAKESADVATGRYRSGVGSILDVLTAQSALESARAEEVQSRTDWFLAVAQLAHDTGTLESRK